MTYKNKNTGNQEKITKEEIQAIKALKSNNDILLTKIGPSDLCSFKDLIFMKYTYGSIEMDLYV